MIALLLAGLACTCRTEPAPVEPAPRPRKPVPTTPVPEPEPPRPADLDPSTFGHRFYAGPVGEVAATGMLPEGATSCFPNLVLSEGRIEKRSGTPDPPFCNVTATSVDATTYTVALTECGDDVMGPGPHEVRWPEVPPPGDPAPATLTWSQGDQPDLVFHQVKGTPSSLYAQCKRALDAGGAVPDPPTAAPKPGGGAARRPK